MSCTWPNWLAPGDGCAHFADSLASALASRDFQCTLALVPDARRLNRAAFEHAVADAYRGLHRQLDGSAWPHPVRYWSFIPGIHDVMGPGLDRYMAFNSGRFAAFTERFGSSEAAGANSPTASGVGSPDDRLIVACLSARAPGQSVENPRQSAAYRYSARFGPRPPCFARATILPGAGPSVLVVGGTASITGEESRHLDDLDAQIDETLRNLAAVVGAAIGSPVPVSEALGRYQFLRVFVPARTDAADVRSRLHAALPADVIVEWRKAELCRAELLVEIEGVAVLSCAIP